MTETTRLDRTPQITPDRWSKWVLGRRFGGNDAARLQTDRFLEPIRAHVLQLAAIRPGDVVVDIASRDGYMGLGAVQAVGDTGHVYFTESAPELLDACREQVRLVGAEARCSFVTARADDVSALPDNCADVVLMRSVLNYVPDKRAALAEWLRLLRPDGRLAFIQMFPRHFDPNVLLGYDISGVADLGARVRAVMEASKPLTYTDFDERDLLVWLREVGFRKVDLHFEVEVSDRSDWPPPDWDVARDIAAGPDQPTLGEAIAEALDPAEAERFVAVLRPQVEKSLRSVHFRKAYVGASRSAAVGSDGTGR